MGVKHGVWVIPAGSSGPQGNRFLFAGAAGVTPMLKFTVSVELGAL